MTRDDKERGKHTIVDMINKNVLDESAAIRSLVSFLVVKCANMQKNSIRFTSGKLNWVDESDFTEMVFAVF